MNQILRCDWLPERARWSYLARSGLPAVSRKKNFPKSHIINPLLTKFVRSRWLDIGFVLFFASLWTSTASRSINTQKKRTRPISSHLDRTNLVNNPYLLTCYLPSARAVPEITDPRWWQYGPCAVRLKQTSLVSSLLSRLLNEIKNIHGL